MAATGSPRLRRYVALVPWLGRNWSWLRCQDVVHCHLTFAAVAGTFIRVLRAVGRSRRPRIVETFHGVGMPIKWWQRRLAAYLARSRDGFALMAQDRYWSDFATRNPQLPLAVIPNGVAVTPRSADMTTVHPRPVDRRERTPVIGTIGRVVAERTPLAMLDVFIDVDRRLGGRVELLIGGEGPLLDAVRRAGDAAGLGSRLRLPGLVVDPASVIAALDLYVSLNVGAVTGIAGLEAAAAGVPVVSLQMLRDHRLTDADWIWSSPDTMIVAEEVVRLLNAPEERAEIARKQRAHVLANHSAAAMADAYVAFYETAGAIDTRSDRITARPAPAS